MLDPSGKLRAHFKMFQNEPPCQWNRYKDCIVAAVDKYIGLCARLPNWCEHKLNIKQVPLVRLTGSPSTISPLNTPFWDIHDEHQANNLLLKDTFKWWETPQEK